MKAHDNSSGIERYFRKVIAIQTEVIESQRQKLEVVAAQMATTIAQDGRIFIFGTGHSHMMAEEAFYRAGGLAPVVPIFSSALMLHEKPNFCSRLERTGGLAEVLLGEYQVRAGEMILIFSNSGVNRLPVEMALKAKDSGLFVVTVSSLAYAGMAPLSSLGKRLDEAADIAIDNCGEPGDALVQIQETDWHVGPSSTISGALIWNCLVTECVERLYASGVALPVFASFNMPGAAEHNAELLEKWRMYNPHL
jgi:uncharacterized phosphosugar-binding protein